MGEGRGGVDVVTFSIDGAGEVSGISQFGSRERDAFGAAGAAGFVAQVVGVGGLERFDHGGQYSLLRGGPHG